MEWPRDFGYRCADYPVAIRVIQVVMTPSLKLTKPKWIPKD